MNQLWMVSALFLAGSLAAGVGASAQDAVVEKNVSAEKLESILKGLNIESKKSADPKRKNVYFYNYIRKNNVYRIHNYAGQDLWIDVVFSDPLTLQDVNKWNVQAKFSRAVLVKQGEKTTVSLEAQLDCLGGVHDNLVRQFIRRFETEVARFEKTLAK